MGLHGDHPGPVAATLDRLAATLDRWQPPPGLNLAPLTALPVSPRCQLQVYPAKRGWFIWAGGWHAGPPSSPSSLVRCVEEHVDELRQLVGKEVCPIDSAAATDSCHRLSCPAAQQGAGVLRFRIQKTSLRSVQSFANICWLGFPPLVLQQGPLRPASRLTQLCRSWKAPWRSRLHGHSGWHTRNRDGGGSRGGAGR